MLPSRRCAGIIAAGLSMPTPSRKTAPTPTAEAPDLLAVLVAQRVLSQEQVERLRRAQKVNGLGVEQAVLQLGLASDAQIAQALAAHAGLPYVKINPLDLDLDVVTKAIAGPFARKHGMVAIAKTQGPHHGRGPRSLRAVPARGHPPRHRARGRPGGGDARGRGGGQQGLLRPQVEPAARRAPAHREPDRDRRPRQPGVPVEGHHRARSRGRARGQGARPHPRLRVRAARLRHPLRAQARA